MAEKFTIDEAVQTGWSKFLENLGPLLLCVTLPMFGIPMLLNVPEWTMSFISAAATKSDGSAAMSGLMIGLTLIMLPVKMCVSILLQMGAIRISLKAVDGQSFGFNDYIEAAPNFLNYLAAGFLYGCMMFFGTLCLIIPGLIAFVLFHWYGYLIIDKKFGPLQALSGSLQLCKGAYADLAILWLVMFAIGLVGLLCLIIGVFPAQLVTLMCLAHVYRRLVQNTPELSV